MLEEIEDFIEKMIEAYQLPGVAAAVIVANEIILQKGFGVQNIETNVPISINTMFQMGSLSKAFVSTAVMQLAEQGKLDIHEKLITYLPYFRLKDERYKDITIRQILSHTSGIPDIEDFEWERPQNDPEAPRRYIQSFTNLELIGAPGEIYHYSNRAYDVMSEVIHEVSGKVFEEYIKDHLFRPLRMFDSTFIYPEISKDVLAWPHQLDKNFKNSTRDVYPYNRIHAPSSTLYSSLSDMINWMKVNLNNGRFDDSSLVSEEGHALLTHEVATTEPDTYMCLAWKKAIRDGDTLYASLGGEPGFRSFLVMSPDKKLAVIISINSDTLSAEHIGLPIIHYLLGRALPVPRIPIYFPMGRRLIEKGIAGAINEYYYLKDHCPDEYDFNESHLNDLAFKMLNKRRKADEAAHIFEFSLSFNKSFWWTYSGLAQAYERLGRTDSAIKNYEIALSMNPGNQNIIQRLQKISYSKSNAN